MEYRLKINGQRFTITPEQVTKALRKVRPDRVRLHGVEIGGKTYPVNQALSVAFGLSRADLSSQNSRRIFRRLGFTVCERPSDPLDQPEDASESVSGEPEGEAPEEQVLRVGPLLLVWSRWVRWRDLEGQPWRPGARVPRGRPGVYEARLRGRRERLVIGKASDLFMRVMDGLVRGSRPHNAGHRIREREVLSRVEVRWATCPRPAAAEEALHSLHLAAFGRLPKYTQRT